MFNHYRSNQWCWKRSVFSNFNVFSELHKTISYLHVYQKKRNIMCNWKHKFGTFPMFSPWLSDSKRLVSRGISLFSFSIPNNFYSGNHGLCGFFLQILNVKICIVTCQEKIAFDQQNRASLSSCCSYTSSFVMFCCHPLSSFSFLGFVFTYIFHRSLTLPFVSSVPFTSSFFHRIVSAICEHLCSNLQKFQSNLCVQRNKVNFIKI